MDADFLVALIFGGVVVVVFAWDQFKRPSYQGSQELERLAEFLAPPDLRKPRIYNTAYAAYAAILLSIYLLLCTYATVPILQLLGIDDFQGQQNVQVPAVPLAISLAMIGLAPPLPILQKFEEKIRVAAHYMSGIPAQLLRGARVLQQRKLDLNPYHGLAISQSDWDRAAHYRDRAMLDDPDGFADEVLKILALRSWVLEDQISATDQAPRPAIVRKKEDVRERIDRLVLAMDALSGFPWRGANRDRHDAETHGDPEAFARAREDWSKLKVELHDVSVRMSALLMLLVEHRLIAAANPARFDPEDPADAARAKLTEFLKGLKDDARSLRIGEIWCFAVGTAVVVSFLWVIPDELFRHLLGAVPNGGGSNEAVLSRGIASAFTAFLAYGPAFLVALTLHARWLDAESHARISPAREWGRIFLFAFVASLLLMVAFNLVRGLMSAEAEELGVSTIISLYWPAVWAAVQVESLNVLLGPILAIGLVAVAEDDVRRRSEKAGKWVTLKVIVVTVLIVMLIWAPIASLLIAQVNCQHDAECASHSLASLISQMSVHLILESIRSFLIGASVILVSIFILYIDRVYILNKFKGFGRSIKYPRKKSA